MIYTLTLNPAIDRELTVPDIVFDTVLRASDCRTDAGGKGFNVSRMLMALGAQSTAVAFAGGHNGDVLKQELQRLGIATDFVAVNGETRVNISIVTPKNAHYVKVNEAGPKIGPDEQAAMIAKVRQLARPDDWWVVSGSLPPGAPSDFYATLVRLIRAAGAKVALDTSGKALQLACVAQPHFIKPNRDELAELTGLPVAEMSQVAAALHKARAMTGGEVLVSLGKDGAMFCAAGDLSSVWLAHSPKIQERNPIGAGDSMLAGVIWGLSEGQPLRTALAWGLACGAAAASLPGTGVGSRADVASLVDQVSFTLCHYL